MPRVAIRDAEYRRAYKARKGLEYYYRDHAENKEALLRVRVHRAVKQGYRGGSAVRALGC